MIRPYGLQLLILDKAKVEAGVQVVQRWVLAALRKRQFFRALVQTRFAMGDDELMPTFVPFEELFKGRHFDREIVVLCVRWYLSFKLSYRDLVARMAERGIGLAHTTILRWVQRYTLEFEQRWNRYAAES